MKLLSIVVPCYNSEDYLDRCLASLLTGGDDVEIIIVDDGSTDGTPEIADRYARDYPDTVKVIHKENGGHGSGINAGLKAASGEYFKVVDSDDRLDEHGLPAVIEYLKELRGTPDAPDMLLTNYVYDKKDAKRKFVMKPKGLPEGKTLSWDTVKKIKKYHYILMHSITYRTEMLRECKLVLPEHTFYVDNIYAFQPLPYVKTFRYVDTDLYWYFIGREGQSVSEEKLVKQVDQYIRVSKIMSKIYSDSKKVTDSRTCLNYMLNYLEIICTITCIFLSVRMADEDIEKKKQMWRDIADIDPELAAELRRRITVIMSNLPGKAGCAIAKYLYRIFSKVLGLN